MRWAPVSAVIAAAPVMATSSATTSRDARPERSRARASIATGTARPPCRSSPATTAQGGCGHNRTARQGPHRLRGTGPRPVPWMRWPITPSPSASPSSRSARSRPGSPGADRSVERQHDRGKMLARERIEYLLDEGSFHELDMLARHRNPDIPERPYTDGVITGWGTVDGRKVFVFSQDFTLFGGALGEVFAEKIHKVMDLAAQGRRAGHRPQRRRRRPHPGGRRSASPATAASSTATCWPRASSRRSA